MKAGPKARSRITAPTYQMWLQSEAILLDTDGCSCVTGFHLTCCLEHDVSFHRGQDPRDAYRLWREGEQDPWDFAVAITFHEANRRFRKCHQAGSVLGRWSPMSWWRWAGVQWFSKDIWAQHRKARP